MSDTPFRERTNDRRVGVLLLLGLTVLFGGLYVVGYLVSGDKVPRGTTVAGVAIGGQAPEAAQEHLEAELADEVEDPVRVRAEGQRGAFTPEQAGLAVDVEESVRQAGGGRSWRPSRLWNYFAGGDDYDAVLDVDEAALGEALEEFAADVDQPPVEGGVTFKKGRPVASYPQPGLGIDRDAAAQAVQDGWLDGNDEAIALPTEELAPAVPAEEIDAALEEFAEPAASGPVTISFDGEQEVTIPPRAFTRALSLEPEDGALEPVLDEKALLRAIRPAMREVSQRPRNATVQLVDGKPTVVPGKKGITFDREQVTDQFLDAVTATGEERTITVDAVVARPAFTTQDARDLEIKEVVSEFTTYYPHAEYRNVNLGRAAELVNGTVLKPGETFSMNDTVGERTAENGFTEGFIIANGILKEDLGGGVSQVATTLFNAAFFAGLEDVEHRPHSFYIDRYPVGREATVVWGALDLKFKNTTPYGILIESWVESSTPGTQGEMHVRMWSTEHWDISTTTSERYNFTEPDTRYLSGPDCVPHEGYGGFDIDVYRIFRKPGSDEVVRRETFHTTYTPSDTVVCTDDESGT